MPHYEANEEFESAFGKPMSSFMKVEDVLRYIKKNALAIYQYKAEGNDGHFFKCSDLETKIGKSEFRVMECEVVQYLFLTKI